MQAYEPTFWLLNGPNGWRTGTVQRVRAGNAGLSLAPLPDGPLSLRAPDGSLGGLGLPRGFAAGAAGEVYLLGADEPWLKRLAPGGRRFSPLPLTGAAPITGSQVRQLRHPRNLAVAGANLYLADTGNRRVQVVDCTSLVVRHVWRPPPSLNITDSPALARRLQHTTDPFVAFLRRLLSAPVRTAIDAVQTDTPLPKHLAEQLRAELGQLAEARSLYAPAYLERHQISADLHERLTTPAPAADIAYGNQLLLAAIFPEAISVAVWEPVDVAAHGTTAYILDRAYGRVYTNQAGSDELRLLIDDPQAAGRWNRILVDRAGRIALFDEGLIRLEIFDEQGRRQGEHWAEPMHNPLLYERNDWLYILDHRHGRVFRYRHAEAHGRIDISRPWVALVQPRMIVLHLPATLQIPVEITLDEVETLIDLPHAAQVWQRIAVDAAGRIYLHHNDGQRVDQFDPTGQTLLHQHPLIADVHDAFDPPPLWFDGRGRFVVAPRPHQGAADRPAPDDPLAGCFAPPANAGTPRLGSADLLDAAALAERLHAGSDPPARYLAQKLSAKTHALIAQHSAGATPPVRLIQALRDDLNRLLDNPAERFPADPAFACVADGTTADDAAQAPAGVPEQVALKRRVLAAAFPGLIAPAPAPALAAQCFDRAGEPVTLDPTKGRRTLVYATEGVWISQGLDSGIERCQWHRLELELGVLPDNTHLVVSTFSDDRRRTDADIETLPEEYWKGGFSVSAGTEAAPAFLVQSRAGRYLWVRVQLFGDGYATPKLTTLRVHYPRVSYLEYLPAIYAADDEGRWFLERFLAIMHDEWSALERRIADTTALLDPRTVPAVDGDDGWVRYLAAWLALPLEGSWTAEQKRTLLQAIVGLSAQRGRLDGVRAYIQAHLYNLTGLPPALQSAFPVIVEGFRERRHVLLTNEQPTSLPTTVPLWSQARTARLQLDQFAQVGMARLVSRGDPDTDLFRAYAHRFRIVVPAAWVRTPAAEEQLHRAIAAAKPAHTSYDLHLVAARMRIGVQATLGVDTIIGAPPQARLARNTDNGAWLGHDSVLANDQTQLGVLRLTPGRRVGDDLGPL
jgi:phage tail-like protein